MGQFQERQLAAGGHELGVLSGGESPRDYVLVHGIGVSPAYFRPLAEELALRDRVHALPGQAHVLLYRAAAAVADCLRAEAARGHA